MNFLIKIIISIVLCYCGILFFNMAMESSKEFGEWLIKMSEEHPDILLQVMDGKTMLWLAISINFFFIIPSVWLFDLKDKAVKE